MSRSEVPHLAPAPPGGPGPYQYRWIVPSDHDRAACADLGGRCGYEALACLDCGAPVDPSVSGARCPRHVALDD